ncbi:hypothetical protein ACSQ67_011565 [Phaseolus vulgaris]
MSKTPKEKAQKKCVESHMQGTEYNDHFARGSEKRAREVNIVNTGATFTGDGNGSHYVNCQIDMKSDFKSSPSPMKVQRSPS